MLNSHRKGVELHDAGAHAHRVAEEHDKQDHLTGHEQSRQAEEHAQNLEHQPTKATVGHGVTAFGHNDIAALAHQIWLARGRPEGTQEEDWLHAVEELRNRSHSA